MSKEIKEYKECEICCFSKKSVFSCPYCDYNACTQCCERVILDSINDPSCVSCKKAYSSDFFHETFTNVFITKKYKAHREQILYEKEKSLLPATQVEVERRLKKQAIEQKMRDIRAQIDQLKGEMMKCKDELWVLESKTEEKSERREFVCQCPSNDCRGFLSTRYKCSICGIQACSDCREIKRENEDHKCDPNTLETIKELQKTTRSCPNCQTRIFKIEGCDQMWCTQCNVAFCWRTGKIEKGIIHNPHYFEYMRRNGQDAPRNPHEVRCGGLPRTDVLKYFTSKKKQEKATEIYRTVNHLRDVNLRVLPTHVDNQSNLELRVDFMMKTIDENAFKTKLQRKEKDRLKKLEQRDIIEMYCNVVQDLFIAFETDMKNPTKNREKSIDEFFSAEQQIRKYSFESYDKLNRKYKSDVKCPIELLNDYY